MAIYSLNHKPVGKSTQKDAYTASAHVNYITRVRALHHLEAARMPATASEAAQWLMAEEDRDRKNARVIDKVMLALPRELSPEQRVALVRAFAEQVTRGRASWLAAFHENTDDAGNPHCHLVIRDRDPETRKRVVGMSEKGSTERLRLAWEEHANQALYEAGEAHRIDRRTLEAQGLRRKATIHEGVRARRMRSDKRSARSRSRNYRNGAGAKRRTRSVNYVQIDQGRSRDDYNYEIQSAYWREMDADRQEREFEAQRAIHRPVTAESEREHFRQHLAEFRAARLDDRHSGYDREREQHEHESED